MVLGYLVLLVYSTFLLFIFLYSLNQLTLVINFFKFKKKAFQHFTQKSKFQSFVTIQLPVYNEKYVVERLLDACTNLNYPKELLEIQILDDSTDETSFIIKNKIQLIKHKFLNINYIKRNNRNGFKAGALLYGLTQAKGEFIAIFDADFLPEPNFLQQTIPHFENKNVGCVQTRWGHLNENFNLLTKLQAFGLNAHFFIEQTGRMASNSFINFNGTAGVWRKNVIIQSGNWQYDTLTEDLDLSYRAQLLGYQIKFLPNVVSPAELPVEIKSLKAQQYRWTKGGAQCAVKLLPQVLLSKNLTVSQKTNSFFHLLNSVIFVCVAITALLSLPVFWLKNQTFNQPFFYHFGSIFIVSFIILGLYYATAFFQNKRITSKNLFNFLWLFPAFLSFSMALSLTNTKAVLQGFLGIQTPFVRTPKFNIQQTNKTWQKNIYLLRKFPKESLLELFFSLYFFTGCLSAFIKKDYGLLPLHVFLTVGFSALAVFSLVHFYKIKFSKHE